MHIVCELMNEPAVSLEVPAGTRWIYVARDTASGLEKLVTHDINALRVWMDDPTRVAPWIEPMEVFEATACETGVEIEVNRIPV